MKSILQKDVEIESLDAFKWRTQGFSQNSLPDEGTFHVNPNLEQKIDVQGNMKPFMGDTVIWELDQEVKEEVSNIQRILYESCSEMLAEPLQEDTLHMTLHDLVNGEPQLALEMRMKENFAKTESILNHIRMDTTIGVEMRVTYLFNMVNTSIVLGLAPVDEESCQLLMLLYQTFQEVVFLPYALTPHITIAYYKPGVYEAAMLEKLKRVLVNINAKEKRQLHLTIANLHYARFTDMNHYQIVGTNSENIE